MNCVNTEKLVKSVSAISGGRASSVPFECGDGWFELLWDLSLTIEAEFVKI